MGKFSSSPAMDPSVPIQRVLNADVGAPSQPTPPKPKARIFYSPVRELYIGVSAGKLQTLSNGTVERLGEKYVRFMPLGDMYGIFKTDDEEIIENLERRMKAAKDAGVKPDVLTEQEYDEKHLTPEVKLQIVEREIETKNRLLLQQVEKNRELMEEIERFREAQQAMDPTKKSE